MALPTILGQVDNAAAPAALLAYERLRRGARRAEVRAHVEFRRQLYSCDVVPHAQAAAAAVA